jgi:hypothetical protein
MTRVRRWNTRATIGLILIVVGVAAAASLTVFAATVGNSATTTTSGAGTGQGAGQVTSVALGKRIYVTGTDENGHLIPRSMSGAMSGSGLTCANCHGADARGENIQMMMGTVEVPDVRWSTLTAPVDDPNSGDQPFDADLFYRALTQGIDPAGKALNPPMPRWNITRAESDALIEYLKTL